MDLFELQSSEYQQETLGGDLPRIAVEAGVRFGWDRWIGHQGTFIGMDRFGASAPYKALYEKFGITADAICAAVKATV
jgi:transketolase